MAGDAGNQEERALVVRFLGVAILAGLAIASSGCTRISSKSTSLTPVMRLFEIEPNQALPVVATAILYPQQVRPGDTVTLTIFAETAPDWHFNPIRGPIGEGQRMKLNLNLPEGIHASGRWKYPRPDITPSGRSFIYRGYMSFRHELRIDEFEPPGSIKVTCQLSYQAGNTSELREPETIELEARCEVLAPN